MSEAVSIEFPHADAKAMWAQIARAERMLGKSAGQALRWAGWHLGKTLGTSTRVAKKRRKVEESSWLDKKNNIVHGWVANVWESGGRVVERQAWVPSSRGGIRPARSKPEALLSNVAQINMRGLAKSAWLWPTKRYGGASINFAAPMAQSKSKTLSATRSDLKGDDMYISLTNKVGYIRQAMNGGAQAADAALGRAARMMARNIDAKIRKSVFGGK